MIKVLGLSLYGPLAASTRYRLEQYIPGLSEYGIGLQIHHLLGDEYLRCRFRGRKLPLATLIQASYNRLSLLLREQEFDTVILYAELFPFMPGWLERQLIKKPYIYDFDDAFYLKYRRGRMRLASSLLGTKFDTVMSGAAVVMAGSHILADYSRQHNSNTHYFPTVVDTEHYLPRTDSRGSQVFTVGWIGSPTTVRHLSKLVKPLSMLGREGSVRFIVIGGKAPSVPDVDVIEIAWNEQTEIDLINSFDVGVMPLHDDAFTRGKCAFKLIQYMACTVPVVASPVGANIDVVTSEVGVLAATSQEWLDALRRLRDHPNIRADMGCAGRERVLQRYSLHGNLPILADVIPEISKDS